MPKNKTNRTPKSKTGRATRKSPKGRGKASKTWTLAGVIESVDTLDALSNAGFGFKLDIGAKQVRIVTPGLLAYAVYCCCLSGDELSVRCRQEGRTLVAIVLEDSAKDLRQRFTVRGKGLLVEQTEAPQPTDVA